MRLVASPGQADLTPEQTPDFFPSFANDADPVHLQPNR